MTYCTFETSGIGTADSRARICSCISSRSWYEVAALQHACLPTLMPPRLIAAACHTRMRCLCCCRYQGRCQHNSNSSRDSLNPSPAHLLRYTAQLQPRAQPQQHISRVRGLVLRKHCQQQEQQRWGSVLVAPQSWAACGPAAAAGSACTCSNTFG